MRMPSWPRVSTPSPWLRLKTSPRSIILAHGPLSSERAAASPLPPAAARVVTAAVLRRLEMTSHTPCGHHVARACPPPTPTRCECAASRAHPRRSAGNCRHHNHARPCDLLRPHRATCGPGAARGALTNANGRQWARQWVPTSANAGEGPDETSTALRWRRRHALR